MKDNETLSELMNGAQAALHHRRHQDARGLFLRALETRPDFPDAHYGLATVCYLQGDVLGAAHHFKEVTRFDPLRAGAFINLGALYNQLGRSDDAIAVLKRGIQLDPKRAEGYYNLGLVQRRIGDLERAAEAYREAVRLRPGMAEAHFNLANVLLDQEKYRVAVEQYEEALKVQPNWPEAVQGLALARAGLAECADAAPPTPETAVELPRIETPEPVKGLDGNRPLDPMRHGPVMTEIHHAATEVDTISKNLGSAAAHQLEIALKELANCFLRHDTPSQELSKRFDAFEVAAQNIKHLHMELERLRGKIEGASVAAGKI